MATLAATQLFVAAVAGDETTLVRAPRVRAARFLSLCAWRCNVTRQDEGCASRCEALAAGYTRQDAARDHIRSLAMNEAKSMSERLEAGRSGTRERRICYGHRTAPLLQGAGNASGDQIRLARGMKWRYYSLLDCAAPGMPRKLCLVFKEGVKGNRLFYARSSDGLNFKLAKYHITGKPGRHWLPLFAGNPLSKVDVDEGAIAHNFAVARLETLSALGADFALVGGQQRDWWGSSQGEVEVATRSTASPSGVRFARGSGWPWQSSTWNAPTVVISGSTPSGCIDRRPMRALKMGAPLSGTRGLGACEFDGRLSLVHWRAEFWLYARANLFENAVAGGRYVQVTRSVDGRKWSDWQPLTFRRMAAGMVDMYFFAAQRNPVDNTSLMALFPVSQPPDACIALAFSRDGVVWSEPYPLMRSVLGWRTKDAEGAGTIEWRNEDHPVAGAILSDDAQQVWFYIHHAVAGMSMRSDAKPSVARYHVLVSTLQHLSQRLLRHLG